MKKIRWFIKDSLVYLTQRILGRFPVSILMYHSVGDNSHFFTVRPKEFAKQMHYLKSNNYNVLSLAHVVADLNAGRPLPTHSVVLTFDDGYEDNFSNAYPILKEYNFPATIFVSSGLIGVERAVRGVSLHYLNKEQMLEMQASGLIDFQSHGMSHRNLTELPEIESERELKESKSFLESLFQKKINLFAYPFGASNAFIREAVRGLFSGAVGVHYGYVNKKSSIFDLPRQSIDSKVTFRRFLLKI